MRVSVWLCFLLVVVAAKGFTDDDRRWENPVFDSAEEAAAAAEKAKPGFGVGSPPAMRMFLELFLGASGSTGKTVDRFFVAQPASVAHDPVQQRTVNRFEGAIPRQRRVVEKRLARFGFPELPGLVFCRLVDSVDAFSGLNPASSDRMSRVGGVTYYCRYVVLPLSYVGADNLRELRTSVALNPGLDYASTVRQWQRESYASLVSTFRHELVHVHTNSTLDVPAYSDRTRYPTWFHEGTATYLSGDPHSGLSVRYQEYQNLFFFLVQRHGVRKLRDFYSTVLGGSDVAGALNGIYSILRVQRPLRSQRPMAQRQGQGAHSAVDPGPRSGRFGLQWPGRTGDRRLAARARGGVGLRPRLRPRPTPVRSEWTRSGSGSTAGVRRRRSGRGNPGYHQDSQTPGRGGDSVTVTVTVSDPVAELDPGAAAVAGPDACL